MSRAATLIGFTVLGAAAAGLQLAALTTGRIPTLAAVVRMLRRHPVIRAILILAWLWLGWHLFVRVDR